MSAIIALTACTEAQRTPVLRSDRDTLGTPPDTTITLLFGGDMMSHMPLVKAAWNAETNTHEYLHWFEFVQPIIAQADIAVVNLETTLGGPPYTGYPCFSAPDALAADLQRVGFDVLVTANNHVADKGKRGLERTLRILDSLGIRHTGSYRSREEQDTLNPLMISARGITIALLSYTYSTNGLPVATPNVVNLMHDSIMISDIAKAKRRGADLIIPVLHWGHEYQTVEHASQRKTAEVLASQGVDAIIGMHPHVLQPIRQIVRDADTVPIAYSIGNFISNMRQRYRDGGAMIKVTATRRNGVTRVTSIEAVPFYVWKGRLAIPDSTNGTRMIRNGFYVIPESHVSILPSTHQARQFFDDARRIIGPTYVH